MKRSNLNSNLRPVLLARRDLLRQSLRGELSLQVYDDDEMCEDQIFSQLAMHESLELAAIDEALERMREGTYGICECGRTISIARLEALPYARICIECQRQNENSRSAAAPTTRSVYA